MVNSSLGFSLNADLYLSIHLNYLQDTFYSGIQVFGTKENLEIAKIVQNSLNKTLNSNRDAKIIPSDTYMYNKLKPKGLLIECGFLSNFKERNLLLKNEKYFIRIKKTVA